MPAASRRTPAAAPIAAAAVAAAAALPLAPPPADAQVRAGGHGTYRSKLFDGTFGAGARAEFELGFIRRGLTVSGLYERFFPDCEACSSSEIGGQLFFAPQGPLYVGLGAGHQQFDDGQGASASATEDWTFNFVAGLRLSRLPVIVPFLEFRQEFGSENLNEQTFSLGILISPSRARTPPRRPPSS